MGEVGPGSGRYFPFPVPESNPMCPGDIEPRNLAMMGQGFCLVSVPVSREGAWIPCISWTRNGQRFVRTPRAHAHPRVLEDFGRVGSQWQ